MTTITFDTFASKNLRMLVSPNSKPNAVGPGIGTERDFQRPSPKQDIDRLATR